MLLCDVLSKWHKDYSGGTFHAVSTTDRIQTQ